MVKYIIMARPEWCEKKLGCGTFMGEGPPKWRCRLVESIRRQGWLTPQRKEEEIENMAELAETEPDAVKGICSRATIGR